MLIYDPFDLIRYVFISLVARVNLLRVSLKLFKYDRKKQFFIIITKLRMEIMTTLFEPKKKSEIKC